MKASGVLGTKRLPVTVVSRSATQIAREQELECLANVIGLLAFNSTLLSLPFQPHKLTLHSSRRKRAGLRALGRQRQREVSDFLRAASSPAQGKNTPLVSSDPFTRSCSSTNSFPWHEHCIGWRVKFNPSSLRRRFL